MAEVFSVVSPALSLVAATAKTGLELATPSTQSARIVAVSFWFDGSVAGNNCKCELVRYTTTGTGTAYTPLRFNGEAQNKAALCTAKVNDTVEPGTPTILKTWTVPLSGGFAMQWPLGREAYQSVSQFFGLRFTSPVAVTSGAWCDLEFEE